MNGNNALPSVCDALKRMTMRWASTDQVDFSRAAYLRKQAALLNHRHYLANIPSYKRLCDLAGVKTPDPDFETIVDHLMVTDDIFKSYPQAYLDKADYRGMNNWLSDICDKTVSVDVDGLQTIDEWIARLARAGIHLVFSSGTSGNISFVPRDEPTWQVFTGFPLCYLPQHIADRGGVPAWKGWVVNRLACRVAPETFIRLVSRFGMKDTDGYFLNFSGGNQGIQLVGQIAGRLTGNTMFLYEQPITATAVRGLVRGVANAGEQALVDAFMSDTVLKKEANYERIIRHMKTSVRRGRKVILFGAPFLLNELCERIRNSNKILRLRKGSGIIFGGGWKTFEGENIPETDFLAKIRATFGVPEAMITEGYSMTEINGVLMKCPAGRYHIPPHLEVVIFDESLTRQSGTDLYGILGIIDPFAASYPGFIITGDSVHLKDEGCDCGRSGPALVKVGRTPGREVKGCGGIMAAVNA